MRIILTHTDLDGAGAWLVLDYFNIQYDKIMTCDYNDFDKEEKFNILLNYDEIIMTDYSVSNIVVEKLLSQNKIVKILDHHDNENSPLLKAITNPNFEYVFDSTKSGTLITYEYFYKTIKARVKKSFADMIVLIDTYDLFKTTDDKWTDAQNMNRVFYGCLTWGNDGIEKYQWIKDFWFNKISKSNEWYWTDFEKKKIDSAIASENKEFNSAKATYKEYVDNKGFKYAVAVASKKISIVALRLLDENPQLDYLVMINNYTKQWDKLSIRSPVSKNFNCNQLLEAKGHPHAAGAEVDPKFAMDLYRGLKQLSYKDDKI